MGLLVVIISAAIGAVATIVSAIIMSKKSTDNKLDEIHVLVNSRLTAALEEIAALRDYIDGDQSSDIPPRHAK